MRKLQLVAFTAIVGLVTAAVDAGPPVRISIGIGIPGPYYRPYGYAPWYGGYGYPYSFAVPGPVVFQAPGPMMLPGTVVGATPAAPSTSGGPTAPQTTPALPNAQATFDFHAARLLNPDENVRRDSVRELGKMKSERALDPLTATLAGDKSPLVREAAARALALIGSPRALPVLVQASQTDNDRDVRQSAQIAVDLIRAKVPRN